MKIKKTYDVLAEAFLQEEVETCFALLGDANMNWATRLAEGGCNFVYVRHEHCAVSAAMSYARATGRVGVASVTCGPGLTQIMTALPAAVRANIPLVIFAGESPLKLNWYNQEIDQAPFVTATGAAYHKLHHPGRMPVQIRDAFLQARREMRPIVLGIPFDLQELDWADTAPLPEPSHKIAPDLGPVPPNADDVARAAEKVNSARRIIIMAGRGAYLAGAASECESLAQHCDGLLATSLPARGLFRDDRFNLGIAGGYATDIARDCFDQADLVIAVGCSLAYHNSDGNNLFGNADVLQIDLDPAAVIQGRIAARYHIRADAKLGVAALLDQVSKRQPDWRSDELAERIKTTPPDSSVFPALAGLHDPRAVIAALEAALPHDWEMVNSSGHCAYFSAHMPSRPVEKFHTIREFGAIGNGISYAMGVAAARPDHPVVLFDGDGSLIMHIQELETIARHGMKILICVLNDGAYGSEIHKLRAEGFSEAGAVFGRPDFAAIARGFGLKGERILDLNTIANLVGQFDGSGAAIWDFHLSDLVVSPPMQRAHPPKQH